MKKVFILGACRTPIGKMGGILSRISAVELASIVIKESVRRADIAPECVDHVYMGCVLQAGLGQNIARQASLKAGLPCTVTAETLNAVCGSGLDSVNMAARMIQAGDADVVVAGGTESMSQAPFAMMQGRFGYRMGSPAYQSPLIDTMIKDALWDSISDCHMGMTAENVADQWNISREEMDEFAVHSQEKTQKAIKRGDFVDEIVSIEVDGNAGNRKVDTDEGPRPGTSMEKLGTLKPVFKEDGKITAGNASGISDGAAAVVLVGEDKVREWNLIPMAEWLGGALGGGTS